MILVAIMVAARQRGDLDRGTAPTELRWELKAPTARISIEPADPAAMRDLQVATLEPVEERVAMVEPERRVVADEQRLEFVEVLAIEPGRQLDLAGEEGAPPPATTAPAPSTQRVEESEATTTPASSAA